MSPDLVELMNGKGIKLAIISHVFTCMLHHNLKFCIIELGIVSIVNVSCFAGDHNQ